MTNEEARKILDSSLVWPKMVDEECEALGMAIKALEQEPCEDAISRHTVFTMIFDNKSYFKHNLASGFFADKIMDLPPVTPQPTRWIPVSERLPEDGRAVLIYAWSVHYVIARYDSFRTENGYKKTWVTADAWNGNTEIRHEVIAWMPLPEPYKAESEDKE